MKVTNRNARIDKAGKHNDRNFNLDNAPHIDKDKISENKYWTYNGDNYRSFDELEKEFYERHFSDYLEACNSRNIKARHPDRNRDVNHYVRSRNTRPEDKILQIGNMDEHATPEELWECALAYVEKFDDIYGDHCKILDMALHLDEATPHVHIRRVWIAEDEHGNEYVNQGKALEQLGIQDPDQSRPTSKYNNPKISFTQSDIRLFQDICIEKGLSIDIGTPEKREHLSTLQYKKQEISKDIEELERTRDRMHKDIDDAKEDLQILDDISESLLNYFENTDLFSDKYADELEEARKKERAERLRILISIYHKEMSSVLHENDFAKAVIRADIGKDLRHMERFLEKEGLLDKYQRENRPKEESRSRTTGSTNFF